MRGTILSLLIFLLTACGFHLRGSTIFPPEIQTIAIQTPAGSDLFRSRLQEALRGAGVQVVTQNAHPNLILSIKKETIEKIFSSVSSNVQSQNFILTYSIHYQLFNARLEPIFPLQILPVTRRYDENANQILASTHEEDRLIEEMKMEALQQLIARLAADDTVKVLLSIRIPSSS
jgi:LPS-assembly lipoprotein